MAESFSEWLRTRSEPDWTAVVTHPFTTALGEGTIADPKMRSYLIQDYQFVDEFLALLGSALAKSDNYSSRLSIAASITVVTSDENTYFQRAFDAFHVPDADRTAPELDPATVAFRELMTTTNTHGSYADVLTVLLVAEWTYLSWAQACPSELPENFVHAEWIRLHNNSYFREWVRWLRAELDRVGAGLGEQERAECLRLFQQATKLELDFFDSHG